jgi:hypothetical protein
MTQSAALCAMCFNPMMLGDDLSHDRERDFFRSLTSEMILGAGASTSRKSSIGSVETMMWRCDCPNICTTGARAVASPAACQRSTSIKISCIGSSLPTSRQCVHDQAGSWNRNLCLSSSGSKMISKNNF